MLRAIFPKKGGRAAAVSSEKLPRAEKKTDNSCEKYVWDDYQICWRCCC